MWDLVTGGKGSLDGSLEGTEGLGLSSRRSASAAGIVARMISCIAKAEIYRNRQSSSIVHISD